METKQQAACYIRVSTEEQTEYSPEAQRRALEGDARQHGYSIDPAHVYVDAGISGRRAETRPAFMAMIAAAKGKPPPFTAILVHKFDRFARNREDSIVYKSLLRRQCGVQVISITEHLEDDRMGLILEAMLEAMKRDKKARGGIVRFVLPRDVGNWELVDVEDAIILEHLAAWRKAKG